VVVFAPESFWMPGEEEKLMLQPGMTLIPWLITYSLVTTPTEVSEFKIIVLMFTNLVCAC